MLTRSEICMYLITRALEHDAFYSKGNCADLLREVLLENTNVFLYEPRFHYEQLMERHNAHRNGWNVLSQNDIYRRYERTKKILHHLHQEIKERSFSRYR